MRSRRRRSTGENAAAAGLQKPRATVGEGSWKLPRPGVRCEFGREGGGVRRSTRVMEGGPGGLVDGACLIQLRPGLEILSL